MTCIIVEDGNIIEDANTYITVDEAESLLNNIGETFGEIPTATIELNLLKATRYLESFRSRYKGSKVSSTQTLQFPRVDVIVDGFLVGSDSIPNELKYAQALSAMVLSTGEDLQQTNDGRTITSETIAGAISVVYADNGVSGNTIHNPLIDTYLNQLLKGKSHQLYRA
jgi:hypothetical protein